ncbi:MAG: hypothetical protein M1826_007391 [Phylliscum demangeonii]|nr:MAG: hypothetical protein M1826_007391 [Phylliscum demangeonii]
MSVGQMLREAYPPKPAFTEKDVPDLSGKVYLITGGSSGIGLELARILYGKKARVYIAGRSEASFDKAVQNIKAHAALGTPTTGPNPGALLYLALDLTDLRTIKPAVESFLAREDTLHSVWYNAGVMMPPKGSPTVQGFDLEWGTNVVAHFLLHTLLTPVLVASAARLPADSVRTVWVSSDANSFAPAPDGIEWDDVNNRAGKMVGWKLYGQSKAAAILLSYETAQRLGSGGGGGEGGGVVSVALNPGHLKSGLQRHVSRVQARIMNLILFEPRYGALTELFAAFSDQLSAKKNNGAYIIPWGRFGQPRKDIKQGYETRGTAKRLWLLLEEDIQPYL